MASTIPEINAAALGAVSDEIATKQATQGDRDALMANTLVSVADAARADIEALQTGGGGSPGAAGKNAFTVTSFDFDWGNGGEPLFFVIPVGTGDWMVGPNQWIYVGDGVHGGTLTVDTVGAEDPESPGYQLVTATDHNTSGNPTPGTTILAGAKVSPSGRPA